MDLKTRFGKALIMRQHYEGNFELFLRDYFEWLGFSLTEIQADIGRFLSSVELDNICVMAQRGEAKSTIALARALWALVLDPKTRVLIVSAGEDFANTMSYAMVKSILNWDRLDYLRPDKAAGDRASMSEGFDVHYTLRGVDKQPSVKSIGITGQLQGNRADILLADDIETTRNGMSATNRAMLLTLTKEFSAICTHGKIIYLGTPQTKDSIYNTLPSRGYTVRIWPGRFPSPDEEERYGGLLAPIIKHQMLDNPSLRTGYGLDGTKGRSVDLGRYSEEDLIKKFLDYQEHGFQLQFMLDTTLSDAMRQQLKLQDLIVWAGGSDSIPEIMHWSSLPKFRVELPPDFPVHPCYMYSPASVSDDWVIKGEVKAYLDPAGGGSDESVCHVGTAVGPYIHDLAQIIYHGGQTEDNIRECVSQLAELGCTYLEIEDNMGHGTVPALFRAEINRQKLGIAVEGKYSTGQKELRIIGRLNHVMKRHRLVIHQEVIEQDMKACRKLKNNGPEFSLFYQLSNVTPDRGSLAHDDRVEALAGMVAMFTAALEVDEEANAEKRKLDDWKQFMQNPMGIPGGCSKSRSNGRRRTR